jgi:hypothetical protein
MDDRTAATTVGLAAAPIIAGGTAAWALSWTHDARARLTRVWARATRRGPAPRIPPAQRAAEAQRLTRLLRRLRR